MCSDLSVFYFIVSRFYILSRKAFATFTCASFLKCYGLVYIKLLDTCYLSDNLYLNLQDTTLKGRIRSRAPCPRPSFSVGPFPLLVENATLTVDRSAIRIGVCFWICRFVSPKSMFSLQYKDSFKCRSCLGFTEENTFFFLNWKSKAYKPGRTQALGARLSKVLWAEG